MHFATAGINVSPWLPPLVALVISFFTSMGGVSGAFLLLPFQMSVLRFTHPSVSPTNQLFNVVAIPSGVYRYLREGRMVWPLAWIVVLGTLPGVLLGAVIRVIYLPDPRNFKLFAAFVLFFTGVRLLREWIAPSASEIEAGSGEKRFQEQVRQRQERDWKGPLKVEDPSRPVRVLQFTGRRLRYEFYGECFDIPVWKVLLLCFVVGIVGGIYGIGGGSIIAPFFVSFFRMPVYTVAGAALLGTFATSVAGVAFYQALSLLYPGRSVAPDWALGLLFGLGGMIGMYLGARCQKFVPARAIKGMLGGLVLYTSLQYGLDCWHFKALSTATKLPQGF